jgi:hypothetical protein
MSISKRARTRNLVDNSSRGNRSPGREKQHLSRRHRSGRVEGIGGACFPPFPPFGWSSNRPCPLRSRGVGRSQGIQPGRSMGKRYDRSRGSCECDGIE